MARFTLPRDLYHGKDAIDALKTLVGKKAIIVVGGLVLCLTKTIDENKICISVNRDLAMKS